MKKTTIEKTIVEILNGNIQAQIELYNTYRKKIKLFLINKYGSRNDHADDISEILMKIFENLKKYDISKSSFDTWVNMIAKNYMIDKSRKKTPIYVSFTSNTMFSDDIDDNADTLTMVEPASYLSSPLDILQTTDSLKFISNQIGAENFSVLTMKYKDGYSYDEIAKEFSSDENKISNRVNYNKSKIKKGEE